MILWSLRNIKLLLAVVFMPISSMCKSSPFVVGAAILHTLILFANKALLICHSAFQKTTTAWNYVFLFRCFKSKTFLHNCTILLMSLFLLFRYLSELFSGASLSDRSQPETNIGEERISLRRSLTDSLAVSSMLLLQPQQVSLCAS